MARAAVKQSAVVSDQCISPSVDSRIITSPLESGLYIHRYIAVLNTEGELLSSSYPFLLSESGIRIYNSREEGYLQPEIKPLVWAAVFASGPTIGEVVEQR